MPALSVLALISAAGHAGSRMLPILVRFGLVGLTLVSVIDSSFIPLPIPGVTDIMLVLFAAGHGNPILLIGLATLGSALGGLLSHAVGQAGGMKFLEKHVPGKLLGRVTNWVEHHSILAIALPAILPPPVPLSPFVLAAGAVHMSRRRFMIAFTASRLIRHAIAVWLGHLLRYAGAGGVESVFDKVGGNDPHRLLGGHADLHRHRHLAPGADLEVGGIAQGRSGAATPLRLSEPLHQATFIEPRPRPSQAVPSARTCASSTSW